jgi:hypothetical protein
MTKSPNKPLRAPMTKRISSERPFQLLYIDFIGSYTRTKNGNTAAIVVLDSFSKFVWSKPINNMTSKKLISFLETEIFFVFGVPESVMSDNGSQLTSHAFKNFLNKYGVEHLFTAVHSPQANAVERVNRNIVSGIRAYVDESQKNWDQALMWITWALRSAINQSVGESPYRILFGQNMINHASHYEILKKIEMLQDGSDDINRDDFMKLLRQRAQKIMDKAFDKNAVQYNLRSRNREFQEGQIVYRRNFVLSDQSKGFSAKLAPKFLKAKVLKRKGNSMYELTDMNGRNIGVYNAKDLKL